MEYLVILYIRYNDGKDVKKAMYTYATDTEALATFHQQIGNFMKDATVKHIMCMVMNTDGGTLGKECWDRPEVKEE